MACCLLFKTDQEWSMQNKTFLIALILLSLTYAANEIPGEDEEGNEEEVARIF